MHSRGPTSNSRVHEWVMSSPSTPPHFPHSNRQTNSSVTANRNARPTPSSTPTKREQPPVPAAGTNYCHRTKTTHKLLSIKELSTAPAANPDDSIKYSDVWNSLNAEESKGEKIYKSFGHANSLDTCLSACEETMVLILCMIHWLTIMTAMCLLSGFVIVARMGYSLGLLLG